MENVLLSYQNQIKDLQKTTGIETNEIAIGIDAGKISQGSYAVAVGTNAGNT